MLMRLVALCSLLVARPQQRPAEHVAASHDCLGAVLRLSRAAGHNSIPCSSAMRPPLLTWRKDRRQAEARAPGVCSGEPAGACMIAMRLSLRMGAAVGAAMGCSLLSCLGCVSAVTGPLLHMSGAETADARKAVQAERRRVCSVPNCRLRQPGSEPCRVRT